MPSEFIVSVLSTACIISGQVTWSETKPPQTSGPTCPIEYHFEGTVLLLKSHRWFVEVGIPEETGIQSFVYRWGQSDAQVGDHTVPIFYGTVDGI